MKVCTSSANGSSWYDERPKYLRIYGASDYAVTDKEPATTPSICVAGIDPDDNIYVLDMWRRQTNSDVWVENWLSMVRKTSRSSGRRKRPDHQVDRAVP